MQYSLGAQRADGQIDIWDVLLPFMLDDMQLPVRSPGAQHWNWRWSSIPDVFICLEAYQVSSC